MNTYVQTTQMIIGLETNRAPPMPNRMRLPDLAEFHACNLREEKRMKEGKRMNETDFLGSGITWIHSDFSCWRVAAANVPLTAQVHETDCRGGLHNTVVALECIERQTVAMRRLLKPDSDSWVRMVRHSSHSTHAERSFSLAWKYGQRPSGAEEILTQVSFFGGDPWPFAVVTTTENGRAQSHVSVAIPYANRAAAGTKVPKDAACFLTKARMIAIARCAKDSRSYRLYGHSLGFTLALERAPMSASYPGATYDLHRLLIREMLGWAYRRQQHLQEGVAA